MARRKPVIRRFDVFLVTLDPTQGSEIRKTRPCVVVSPDEMNGPLNTAIIAPMTTTGKNYPSRIRVTFQAKHGYVVLDQIRTVDKARLVKRLGRVDPSVGDQVLERLRNMFAP